MKSPPGALATHFAGVAQTVGQLLRIERTDGAVYGFTSASTPVEIDGTAYDSAQGLDVTSLVVLGGFAVSDQDLTTLDDGTLFTEADILSGRWRNAAFRIGLYNWASPSDGVLWMLAGTFGNVHPDDGLVRAELLGLTQFLQQPIGSVMQPNCRARFGDSRCKFNLATVTHTATVTGVTNYQTFAASSLAQAADYFGNGVLTWTSGPKTGLQALVKTHTSGGNLVLALPSLLAVEVGDTFSVVKGCRKRLVDCQGNSNVLNFQGEPHGPGLDALTRPP